MGLFSSRQDREIEAKIQLKKTERQFTRLENELGESAKKFKAEAINARDNNDTLGYEGAREGLRQALGTLTHIRHLRIAVAKEKMTGAVGDLIDKVADTVTQLRKLSQSAALMKKVALTHNLVARGNAERDVTADLVGDLLGEINGGNGIQGPSDEELDNIINSQGAATAIEEHDELRQLQRARYKQQISKEI